MERVRLRSSSIYSLGYDRKRLILEVEFVSGEVYRYLNVDPGTHLRFLAAKSKGAFFHRYVLDRYETVRTRRAV